MDFEIFCGSEMNVVRPGRGGDKRNVCVEDAGAKSEGEAESCGAGGRVEEGDARQEGRVRAVDEGDCDGAECGEAS